MLWGLGSRFHLSPIFQAQVVGSYQASCPAPQAKLTTGSDTKAMTFARAQQAPGLQCEHAAGILFLYVTM